ncbi:hypothetical protein M5D96_014254 [Drosophila gunungcola]|uniref:Uncharacterized protein n=1 Tax=Drosophila gunungcola TaxID=103775 RepID=A0A9Q0BIA5_9MUSC|nr:hypothetical protein M5D96_014254 [Drosophila gunungcola]
MLVNCVFFIMFQSFVPRRSQVRGNRTGVKTLFWHLILRRSHTSRDLSRSQETFETEFRPSPQSSQRESDRSQNAILASHPYAAVTPVGICQGARKHLRQSQPSS